jgi:hypothetical protein
MLLVRSTRVCNMHMCAVRRKRLGAVPIFTPTKSTLRLALHLRWAKIPVLMRLGSESAWICFFTTNELR